MIFRRIRLAPWERNLWSVVVAELLTILAFQGGFVLIPYYVQQMGITDPNEVSAWTGAFQSVGSITFAIATPIWGALGDRYGRKAMLIRSMVATTAILALMGLAQTPTQLLLLRVVQGAFTGTVAAASALVATGTPKDRLAYGLGLVQTSVFVGQSLGPMAGGYVADLYSYRAAFMLATIPSVMALLLVAFGTHEPAESLQSAAQARQENALAAFRGLLSSRSVLALIALSLVINLTLGLLGPVLPLMIQELVADAKRLASTAGTISGVFALSAAVSALVVGRLSDRIGYGRTLMVCLLGIAAFFVPQAFATTVLFLGVMRTLQGFFQGGIAPSINAIVVQGAPAAKMGAALGLNTSASSVGFAIGPMLGALLMATTSSRFVFLTCAAALFVAAMALFRVTRQEARPVPAEEPQSP